MNGSQLGPRNRISSLLAVACLIALVNDGWSGRPSPFVHQIILLPFASLFAIVLVRLLRFQTPAGLLSQGGRSLSLAWATVSTFEAVTVLSFLYAAHHFVSFGYHLSPAGVLLLLGVIAGCVAGYLRTKSANWLLGGAALTYAAGSVIAILCFPLNYLRSDMLPVIIWADRRLATHLDPYATMHVGTRLYDFPYLPGVLVAYLPVVALHVDPRWLNLVCLLIVVGLLYRSAGLAKKRAAALVISVFLLSPFLQYRHELYLEPHWLALAGSVVLLQRRRYQWAAAVFGVSMALYQLSWVLWPFLLLFAFRRKGWSEAARAGGLSLAAMIMVVGPFARSAMSRIASNTVGQWNKMPHALADPINASFWVSYIVRPDHLKWVQLAVLTGVFAYCLRAGRCRSLEDTLRWMSAALAIFISLNVLVDGYFYLTLMLVLVMYTLSATGIWKRSELPMSPACL